MGGSVSRSFKDDECIFLIRKDWWLNLIIRKMYTKVGEDGYNLVNENPSIYL